MDKQYFYQTFKLTENDNAERINTSEHIDCETLLSVEKEDENIWDTDIQLDIFGNKEGFGFRYEYPGGYSSYTYDPEVTSNFYYGATLEWLLKFALDEDQRNMISVEDLEKLKEKIAAL